MTEFSIHKIILENQSQQPQKIPASIHKNEGADQVQLGYYLLKSELQDYRNSIKAKGNWQGPLGAFISCAGSLASMVYVVITTPINLSDIWALTAVVLWSGATFLTVAWTVIALIQTWTNKEPTIEEFLNATVEKEIKIKQNLDAIREG